MLGTVNAVKPVWTGKGFKVEVQRDVHSLGSLAQAGFMVYDDPRQTLQRVKDRTLVGSWSDRKRHAVIDFLEAEVAAG